MCEDVACNVVLVLCIQMRSYVVTSAPGQIATEYFEYTNGNLLFACIFLTLLFISSSVASFLMTLAVAVGPVLSLLSCADGSYALPCADGSYDGCILILLS